jgi:hypothetical protein
MNIEECEGYKKLRASIEKDIELRHRSREEEEKLFSWVLGRARHYAEKTGIEASDILDAWERDRNCWHLYYYQEAHQPEIKGNNARVFENTDDFRLSLKGKGFRCPKCGAVSGNHAECGMCDWKAYGLLRTLGKGASVFIKSKLKVFDIFMPVAWEREEKQ